MKRPRERCESIFILGDVIYQCCKVPKHDDDHEFYGHVRPLSHQNDGRPGYDYNINWLQNMAEEIKNRKARLRRAKCAEKAFEALESLTRGGLK